MDLYVFDSELTTVQTTVTSSECLNAIETLELGKAGQLSITLPISFKDSVKEMNIIAIQEPDDAYRYRLYIVSNRTLNNYTMDITAISYPNYALSRVGYVRDLRPNNKPLTELIPQILGNSGWVLNHVDNNLPGYTGSFYYLSRLECLSKISEALACEFDFYVVISKNKINGQYVDAVEMLGRDTDKRFEYGTNALEVVAEYDATEVYTQAIGRGKGEETGDGYGRRIEFTDVEWSKDKGDPVDKPKGQNWVNAPNYTYQLPGDKRPAKIIEFEEITDPEKLLKATYKWLLNNNYPKTQFKAKVVQTGDLKLGDRVQIIRPDLNIRYETRVFKLTRNLLDENLTEIEFGDKIATTPMDKLNSMTTQVNSTSEAINRVQQQVSIIDANGVRVNYGPNEPSVKKKGDIWYKENADGTTSLLRWNGEVWERVVDEGIIADIEKNVDDAMKEAEVSKAQSIESLNKANQAVSEALNASQEAQKSMNEVHRVENETKTEFISVKESVSGISQDVVNLDLKVESNRTQLANQITQEVNDLENKTNTRFVETEKQISLQANQIGPFYPNGSFIDKNFDKYYTRINNSKGAYANIPSGSDYLLLRSAVDGKASAMLTDFIAIDMNKPIEIDFKAYFNGGSWDKANIYVHEYDAEYREVRNANDRIFTTGQIPGKWHEIHKSWIVNKENKPRYIKIEWVLWNSGVSEELRVSNITLTNGQANLSASVNVALDGVSMAVKKDGVINAINVSTEGIDINGSKVHITGQTTIDNAVIKDAMIANLSASKLTAGTIDASKINVINLNAANITGVNAQFVSASFKSASGNYLQIEGDGMVATSDSWYSTKIEYGARGLEIQNWSGDWVGSMRYSSDGPWKNGDGIVLGARRGRGIMLGWQKADGTKSPYSYSLGMDGDTGDWFVKNNIRFYSGIYNGAGNPYLCYGNVLLGTGDNIPRIGGDSTYGAWIGWSSQDIIFKDNRGNGYVTLDRILKACGIR